MTSGRLRALASRWGGGRRAGGRVPVVLLALALLLPVAAAAGVWQWQAHERSVLEDARAEDDAAVKAATLQALTLQSADHREIDAYVDAVAEGSTGEFLRQWKEREGSIRDLLTEFRSVQVPVVLKDGAGLVERTGDRAKVLVAMDGSVTNKGTEEPKDRRYRILMHLAKVDGEWLTEKVEFIDAEL